MEWNNEKLIEVLDEGGVAVMPTDTLYGIVGLAQSASTVERIYNLRKRSPAKRCIVLIADISDLKKFSIILNEKQKTAIKKYWPARNASRSDAGGPGPVSIILPCSDDALAYLHRGGNSLAFRVPKPKALRNLLRKVGPLVAPSANTEGRPPAEDIKEAKKYFGNSVDLYIDGGDIRGKASKVIELHSDGSMSILRE